jgi:hypothetical protein
MGAAAALLLGRRESIYNNAGDMAWLDVISCIMGIEKKLWKEQSHPGTPAYIPLI